MLKPLFYIALFLACGMNASAQDTLPRLSVKNRFGRVIVSWTNPFPDVVLINIQRSSDSLKNFKTILGVTDPGSVTNGYLDAKAPDTKQFYRLFVQQSGGRYFFTNAYRPVPDTIKPKPRQTAAPVKPGTATKTPVTQAAQEQTSPETGKPEAETSQPAPGESNGQEGQSFKPEKNSSQKVKFSNTKPLGADSTRVVSVPVKEMKPPPVYVFVNSLGQVVIIIPEDKKNLYTLKFITETGVPAFTLHKIRDSHLTLEKTNFRTAGWYRCELYENDKYRDKFRVYIPKEL